jgi:eukaryotic-like serine/threonine-protein kinase
MKKIGYSESIKFDILHSFAFLSGSLKSFLFKIRKLFYYTKQKKRYREFYTFTSNVRSRSMTDRLGQQLGNYRLTRLLGQGSFAEVYLGVHTLLGTTVAIKVLHTQVTEDDVTQFQQEALLLASLRHPHIIRILDFGLDRQTPYLVMDHAPNGNLRTRHARGTVLPVSTVVDYVKQIAQALQYAHDRKVIHRDIKPENMLLGENNQILLSDFGIALITQSSREQSTKDMAGTVAYMAPEQIQAHPRPQSDQYSLGIVAYEWLCGTRPFQGSLAEIAIKHSVTLPQSPRQHSPTLSPDIEYVILTSLAKQPEKRFASVSAFATALEQASRDMLPTDLLPPLDTPSPPRQLTEPLVTTHASGTTPAFQSLSTLPNPPAPEKTTAKPALSRRAVFIGATGVAVIAAAGGSVFVMSQLHAQGLVAKPEQTATLQKPTATTQAPTATPQNLLFIYRGHSGTVLPVRWSPDGKRIASGSEDKTVQVWNASDGGSVFTYRGHSGAMHGIAWSPLDGMHIASGSEDKTVRVWNVNDGSDVFIYQRHSDIVEAVVWSPDGKRIASSSDDKTVQVWNASDGSNVFTYTGHSSAVELIAWSPGGGRIASTSNDKTVRVWNANDGRNISTYTGHSDQTYGLAWEPSGVRIASSSGDQTVQVWNASNASTIFIYRGHLGAIGTVAWSPDGKRIASGSDDKTVQVWDASDGSNVFTYRGHTKRVRTVAWSPDGQRIASSSDDGTVQVWHVG